MASRRLYLGRLPHDTRPEDISKHFEGYGRIVDCRVMTGFGFVEFEDSKDADDVVHHFNNKPFLGQSIIVEFAKDTRRRDPEPRERRESGPRRRQPGFRINVTGISRDTSWQDLKDFGREAGSVIFADVDRDGAGVLEYPTLDDAEYAVRQLDGTELRGVPVKLALDTTGARRSPPRRERSRSPYRRREDRDRDRRRSRSPPRRYDDRREERGDREYRRDDRRERDREYRRGGEEREAEPRRERGERAGGDADNGWGERR
ncbi:hypothetical protein FRC03_001300 [Tulasnella sp. 419]|nr:hypothetical protein FRC03_001300 [Tulasnella sp. 419]